MVKGGYNFSGFLYLLFVVKLADVYLATDMVDLCHRDQFDIGYLVAGDEG